ncbi:inositol monophosphatase [Candidatus Daviesbacteria bacterium]|nr:inositol monophosphatase [Candidatus Daviesbacteria bacterium]
MDDKFLKVAKKAALEAGKIILKYYGKKLDKNIKGDDHSNFATQADLEAEKEILRIIYDKFPTHNIISEEAGVDNRNSEYTWVVDPLDGTIVFSAGLSTFSVSIGLLKNNQPILGIVYQVLTKELYYGFRGRGTYLNNKRIRVSNVDDLEKALLGVDFAHRAKRMQKTEKYVLPLIDKIRYPISLGSDALILALIGKGALDGFATDTNIWDCIAGILIVLEAGGKATDLLGKELDWSKNRLEIIVSNGLIHDQILEALR